MSDIQILKRKINELEALADEIERSSKELIEKAPLLYKPDPPGVASAFPHHHWGTLSEDIKELQREVIRKYQRWYSSAYQLIKEYLLEKEAEFVEHYEDRTKSIIKEGVIDLLQFRSSQYTGDKCKIIESFVDKFEIQRSILLSIPDVAEIKELNLRRVISADFVKTEIEQAEMLFDNGFHRAAGTLAGVALEKHLKTLCDINGTSYKPKGTIEPLAQALYKANMLDITELKKVQYLASIRNKCSHPNDITDDEVKSLIAEVKKFV